MPNHHHHHRAGGLRQTNKRNKRYKSSKRSLSRSAGGRVNPKLASGSAAVARSKADRRHMMEQKRRASRQAVLERKRGMGSDNAVPRVVGIISLGGSQEIEERLKASLLTTADQTVSQNSTGTTAKYNVHKKQGTLTYLSNSKSFSPQYGDSEDAAVLGALDLCRVCDMVLFVIDGDGPNPDADVLGMSIGGEQASVSTTSKIGGQDWDHLISRRGDRILAAVKGQGLPTPLTILARTATTDHPKEDFMTMQSAKSIRRSALKRKMGLKQYVGRFATTEFGPDKDTILEVDLTVLDDEDAMDDDDGADDDEDGMDRSKRERKAATAALVRTLCTMAATPPKWIADAPRPYIVADGYEYDGKEEKLHLTGHVRGKVPLDLNALVHVPNLGTYACHSVKKATPPLQKRKGDATMTDEDEILYSEPSMRENLEMFATPDALQGEQNLVGFDEDLEEGEGSQRDLTAMERPAGWSDYQSAWLDAVDDMSAGEEDEMDHGELARELNKKSARSGSASIASGVITMDEDNQVSEEEKKALLEQRRKDQKVELEFPDEVEVEEGVAARDRFARYRSLKSFRKSYWDPKENLPDSYASIYHFASFKATQRDVMSDMKYRMEAAADVKGDFWGGSMRNDAQLPEEGEDEDDILENCVPSGSYVTLSLEKVPQEAMRRLSSDALITAVSLLPHENKVSVLHMGLCQSSNCEQSEDPVKSKDVLTFRCGWRTWKARPVFSQNNLNSDKHKFERFLPQGRAFFAASVFGPVTYSPCPVLVFRETSPSDGDSGSSLELLAVGSMIGADADRIIVKRIVLTGYPVRVHKRHATVKYMFHNPDDVRWFSPAGLTTKHGLHGNILESVGEHGTMKCLFNAPIKQHDTVCLPLYKRVYPKFAPATSSQRSDETASVRDPDGKTVLIVL